MSRAKRTRKARMAKRREKRAERIIRAAQQHLRAIEASPFMRIVMPRVLSAAAEFLQKQAAAEARGEP